MTSKHPKVRKRNEQFASRTVTRIWQEIPDPENPYLARQCLCHGYDLLELAAKKSFIEVLFLLFQGELPRDDQAGLLEALFILFINPGPRHAAARAAMNAAVSRTRPAHFLPIGLAMLGGETGGEEVADAMHFFRKNARQPVEQVLAAVKDSETFSLPGFGRRFGDIDPMPQRLAKKLQGLFPSGRILAWGNELATELAIHDLGWLDTGVVAAALCDLGFHPRAGAGIYQLLRAPGILAHGLELANKPITAMPFLDEEHYVIASEAKKKESDILGP